jgi:MFS superfamily sulfate permease-like transporter
MAAMSFRPFGSLRGYRSEWLSGDAIAGLTVWAVLVPEALAYASIAGAPPVVGLYAAPGALILYAVFGSSRHLVTGPMSPPRPRSLPPPWPSLPPPARASSSR